MGVLYMVCSKCGKEYDDSSRYCSKCGVELSNNEGIRFSKGISWLWVVLSFFLPMFGLMVFIYNGDKKDDKNTVKRFSSLGLFVLNTILVSVVLYGLTNISSNEVVDFNGSSIESVSNTYNEFELLGGDIVLPCSYEEFIEKSGYYSYSADCGMRVRPKEHSFVRLYDSNGSSAAVVEVCNSSDEKKLFTECEVVRVNQNKYDVDSDTKPIVFAGGLYVGMKVDSDYLKSVLGEYGDDHFVSGELFELYEEYKWSENGDWVSSNFIEVGIVNGFIDYICVDKNHK